MAPAVNTWMGQRGVGHCASDSAATSCAYLPSSPRRPSDPYARTLPKDNTPSALQPPAVHAYPPAPANLLTLTPEPSQKTPQHQHHSHQLCMPTTPEPSRANLTIRLSLTCPAGFSVPIL